MGIEEIGEAEYRHYILHEFIESDLPQFRKRKKLVNIRSCLHMDNKYGSVITFPKDFIDNQKTESEKSIELLKIIFPGEWEEFKEREFDPGLLERVFKTRIISYENKKGLWIVRFVKHCGQKDRLHDCYFCFDYNGLAVIPNGLDQTRY